MIKLCQELSEKTTKMESKETKLENTIQTIKKLKRLWISYLVCLENNHQSVRSTKWTSHGKNKNQGKQKMRQQDEIQSLLGNINWYQEDKTSDW